MNIADTINIYTEIESTAATSPEDGLQIKNRIINGLELKNKVVLNFTELKIVTPIFLNVCIGSLYGIFDYSFLKHHLEVININQEDIITLKKVISDAKRYFKEKKEV